MTETTADHRACDLVVAELREGAQRYRERAEAAEEKLRQIASLNGGSGWLTAAEVQRRIWDITGG